MQLVPLRHGVYVDGDKELGCECLDEWKGSDCEIPCLQCANGECILGPTLPDGNGTTVCQCEVGWAGALCDIKCPDCDYDHATCVTDTQAGPSVLHATCKGALTKKQQRRLC